MLINKSKLPLLEFVFILFYIYICLSPKMNATISMIQFLLINLAYTLYIILINKRTYKTIKKLLGASFIIALMYAATTSIVYIDINASNRFLKGLITIINSYYGLVFPILLFYRVSSYASFRQKWILLIISTMILIVVMKSTMTELQINERILKSNMAASFESGNPVVGGYAFVCAIPFLAIGCFYSFLKCINQFIKLIMIFCTLFFLYFIIKSMYSIALLAAILGILICLYVESSHNMKKLFILTTIIGWFCAPLILNFFIVFLDDGDTKLRMIELYNFFLTGSFGDDDLGARMDYYGKGLIAFFQSPIWGQYNLNFNPHSTIIEVLASTGIIGGISLFILLKKPFNILKGINSNFSILPIFYSFLFMALTNPIHSSPPMNICLWFIVPLLFNLTQINHNYETSI